jgi:hypothetical protein
MSEGRFKGHECVEFNGNASNIMTAVIDEHIFMQVCPPPDLAFAFALFLYLCSQASADSLLRRVLAAQVQLTIQISDFKSNPPFAVVLYSASSRTPIGVPPQPTWPSPAVH